MPKTVVGLYDRFEQAQEVVRELVEGGLPRENISMVANDVQRRAFQPLAEPAG